MSQRWYSAPDALEAFDQARSDRLEEERARRVARVRELAVAEHDRRLLERMEASRREREAARVGRPTANLTEEEREMYVAALREGRTQAEAATALGISPRTILRIAKRDPSFKEAVDEALVVPFAGSRDHAVVKVNQRQRLYHAHCRCGWRTPRGWSTRAAAEAAVEAHARYEEREGMTS